MSRRKMDGTEVAIITTIVIGSAFVVFCFVMAIITGIQSSHDSGVCDGKGGTWIDGKCYAHVEVMH